MTTPEKKLSMRTKIIATLGPATRDRERLEQMLDTGLDVCRLNFSHGTHAEHAELVKLVREVTAARGEHVPIVGDLCGPKIRLGEVEGGSIALHMGDTLRMVYAEDVAGTASRLTVNDAGMIEDIEVGQRVLIDDGQVRLVVTERTHDELTLRVTVGGPVSSHKGVNLPDTPLSAPALSNDDRADLDWAIEHQLDFVALSFVRQPDDLYELKRLIKERGVDLPVIIKIEKTEALWHLEELVAHADGVLVARGDLGVETELWRVPLIQKDVVAECRQVGVPVIVATQMLQSMIESPMPTRAEVSDVANAIIDQADAVMLSGETAVGSYPVESVGIMNKVAEATEAYLAKRAVPEALPNLAIQYRPTAAVAHAAVAAARDLGARLVAVWTATGTTVRLVAQHRLAIPVVGLSYNAQVCRQIGLLYGVIPIRVDPLENPVDMVATVDQHLLAHELVVPGDVIVVVTSTRPTLPGATDTAVVHRIGEPVRGE